MLTICAYFDASTVGLVEELERKFESAETKLIAYVEAGVTMPEHIHTVVVGGFVNPKTSVLLETHRGDENLLLIFDVASWLQCPSATNYVYVRPSNLVPDVDLEDLYQECNGEPNAFLAIATK